jgi:hypothetical protein
MHNFLFSQLRDAVKYAGKSNSDSRNNEQKRRDWGASENYMQHFKKKRLCKFTYKSQNHIFYISKYELWETKLVFFFALPTNKSR